MKRPPAVNRSVVKGLASFRGDRAAKLVPQARLAGPMPWVIAIMITLTVVAAAGGLALSNLANSARGELSGAVTVQIVEANATLRQQQSDRAVTLLADDPLVSGLRQVPQAEIDRLLEPWLGTGDVGDAVPVPALIDVQLRHPANAAEIARLQATIADAAPNARIDAQAEWLKPVFSALKALQWLAIALVVLLGITGAAAVWLAARSALGTNSDTIEIVHLLGGTDNQIARIFQRSIAFDAVLGGAFGLILGVIAVLVIGRQFAALDSGMVAGGGLASLDWAVLAAIPVLGVVIAILTARLTVMSALRRML